MMTLSFHKVQFSAQEVLDLLAEHHDESEAMFAFEAAFVTLADERSRQAS